jgi:hypothetical protein
MSDGQHKPQSARDRLALISHHYLSIAEEPVTDEPVEEEPAAEGPEQAPKNDVYTLAVLNTAGDDGVELPVLSLCRSLSERGHSSAIIDSTTGTKTVSFIPRNDSQQSMTARYGLHNNALEDVTRQHDKKPHDVHFLLVDRPESSRLSSVDRVLLTAPATAIGLRHTYISIKQLIAHHDAVQISVIIAGAADAYLAEGSFNRLATEVHRSLDRDILSYGYLPAAFTFTGQTTAPCTAPLSVVSPEITTIAEIISDEFCEWQLKIKGA